MMGHKLGEFSNEEVGHKIIILHEIRNEKIKTNRNNGSFGKCNSLNSFRLSAKWTQIQYKHQHVSPLFARGLPNNRFINLFFKQYTYRYLHQRK